MTVWSDEQFLNTRKSQFLKVSLVSTTSFPSLILVHRSSLTLLTSIFLIHKQAIKHNRISCAPPFLLCTNHLYHDRISPYNHSISLHPFSLFPFYPWGNSTAFHFQLVVNLWTFFPPLWTNSYHPMALDGVWSNKNLKRLITRIRMRELSKRPQTASPLSRSETYANTSKREAILAAYCSR